VTTYRYDALGRRILRQSGAQRVRFFWDGDALLADAASDDDSCGVAREWVYFPDTFEPLLLLSGAGPASILYYHNDPNGCPVRLTDASGELKWAASHTAWGGIARLHTAAVDQPLRLQGQYADEATGLHYNRRRYFDPHIGSFISSDPIGLVASLNPYEVAANLLGWADPSGLVCGPAVRQNSRARWIDARGRFARPPNVASLRRLKGNSVGHVEAILRSRGYTRTNPANPKNQRWTHPDGSEVQIHAYGNAVTGAFKASNNAHAHKSLGRHGNPGTTELADDGVTAVSTHSAAAHIGLKNPSDFPTVAGRPHGS
jgi:RHS repeat-associated protein